MAVNYKLKLRHWLEKFSQNRQTANAWAAKHPAEIFVGLALLFGIIFSFTMYPLGGSDEFTHFPRAYQIQQGDLWADKLDGGEFGGRLPRHIKYMIDDYRDLTRKGTEQELRARGAQLYNIYAYETEVGEDKLSTPFSAAAVYSPVSYIPGSLGIGLARIMHLPLVWYVHFARLFTLFAWVAIVWAVVRILPSGKWYMVAVALLPTSLVQAVTVGPDAFVNGLSWLLIALVLAAFARQARLRWYMLAPLAAAGALLCVTKQGYWLLAAWPLIIPRRYFKTPQAAKMWKIGIAAVLVIASVAYLLFTQSVARQISFETVRDNAYVNPAAQTEYVIDNPALIGWRVLTQPLTKAYDTVFLGIIGILTNRLIYLPVLVIVLLYVTLATCLMQIRQLPTLMHHRRQLRWSAAVIIVGTGVLINLALYIGFTEVQKPVVEGVQGRYFLPLLPLALVLPLTTKYRLQNVLVRQLSNLVIPFVIIGLLYTVFALR